MFGRALNMPQFLILNIPVFWICRGYTEYAWIISEHAWICLNIPKYAWMCLNVPEWLLLFPHCNPLSTWTGGYLFQYLSECKSYSLKDYQAVFVKRQNLLFSVIAGSIWFAFCFKLNIFTRFYITFFNWLRA